MQTMERYLELTDNGRPCPDPPTRPSVRQALVALHAEARRQNGLPMEGAWRLEGEACRRLENSEGYVPPGGWRGLAALAAGCGVLKANREGFQPASSADALVEWTAEQTTRRLVEAFSRRLVPPTTAAGLFILLGIHPAWGVHLAHAAHKRVDPEAAPSGGDPSRRRRDLFPAETLEVVEEAVFGAVATIVATLRQLDPGQKYPLDALAGLVEAACTAARRRAEAQFEPDGRGLDPFVEVGDGDRRETNWRVIDFTTSDLVDALLVPAGAAHRFDDDALCIAPGVFDEVRVGPWTVDQQDDRLTRTLTDAPDSHVA